MHHNDLDKLWQTDGLLSTLLPNYNYRPGQQQFARQFQLNLVNGGHSVIEAPAGIGKTYAYLIPLLLQNNRRAVIATASKLLQDQLYYKDLPLLLDVFGISKTTVLLKGRNNYLCPKFAENNLRSCSTYKNGSRKQQIIHALLSRWRNSDTGELIRLISKKQLAEVHLLVTASSDECQFLNCSYYHQCPFLLQKERAKTAEIVITNQHVLISELYLRNSNQRKQTENFISTSDALVVDEAHRLQSYAEYELSVSWTSYACKQLLREMEPIVLQVLTDHGGVRDAFNRSRKLIKQLIQPLISESGSVRAAESMLSPDKIVLKSLAIQLARLQHALAIQSNRDIKLPGLLRRFSDLNKVLNRWLALKKNNSEQSIVISERRGQHFRLLLAPAQIDQQVKKFLENQYCVLMTSATLTKSGNQYCYERNFVDENAEYQCIDSPFNYQHQSLLVKLPGNKLPDEGGYWDDLVEQVLPLLNMPTKKYLFLVTSYAALDYLIPLIREQSACELFLPHLGDNMGVIRDFQLSASGVLLATASFWEGVDLADCGISGIIVARLPFESPAQGLMLARAKRFHDQGLNFFTEYQLPLAAQRLRQACGRLIRSESDRGVFIVADPRLYNKWYGAVFLESLPPMPIERDLKKVKLFLEKGSGNALDIDVVSE